MRKDWPVVLEVSMYKPRFHAMVLTALACALFALPAAADSQARIVRLSDVQGGVQINKNTGLGFESAFLNLPITQGAQLHTRDNGRAEIEFEDGSTLRITPNTTVEFSALGVSDAGKHVSNVNLINGRVYVNWLGKSGDQFTLNSSDEKIDLTQAAHFRVASSAGKVEVASFRNDVQVTSPSGAVKVDKKKAVTFDVNENDHVTVAKNFTEDAYDEWDKQSVSYHDEYAKNNTTPLGYGYSDLSYYGNFANYPGYGMMWQPYLSGAGWNPFMDGAWSFYPGMGYMWASAYPWGWMPFYYGNWVYGSGFGWAWQPGGFNGWQGGLRYSGAPVGFHAPVVPSGTVSTVVVGRGGPVLTKPPTALTVIRGGSAGLGIARGSVENLHHLNAQVAKTGSVELRPAPQFAATSPRMGSFVYNEPAGTSPSPAGSARAGAAPATHASGTGANGHH
jgi:hypothetical protein